MMIGDLKTVRRSSDSGIEDWFFTERRLGFCASSLVAVFLIGLGWILIRHGFAISSDGTYCIDFIWMWLSSKLALSGDIPRIFDHSGLLASLTMLVEQPSCIFERFNSPPTLLLFTYPLGLMSYSTAFVVWIAATLSLSI